MLTIPTGSALDAALASAVPTVIEVKTDPEVPPLQPHIGFDQAYKFMRTMLKGDTGGSHHVVESARQVLSGILPGDSENS